LCQIPFLGPSKKADDDSAGEFIPAETLMPVRVQHVKSQAIFYLVYFRNTANISSRACLWWNVLFLYNSQKTIFI